MDNNEYDLEDVANLDEAKYESGGKREEEEEEEDEESSKSEKKDKKEKKDKMDEETLAASSLHPKARGSEAMPKLKAMTGVMNVMAGMGHSDLINFFNQVQSQFGPGKAPGAEDKSAQNQSSIDTTLGSGPKTKDAMPKLNVKEDIEEMFNGQDLSEEFKENVSTLFEAAVSARIIVETARLEEEFETKLQEEIATFNTEVTSKLDTYLDYVVENWMKENEVAIESTLRNELAEEFVEGLKNLFAEHYINVPENKVDVLEAMAEKVAALEEKMNEVISENYELKTSVAIKEANEIFEEISSDLALTQKEKFGALAEGIEFDGDLETYAKKLMIVKENYFKNDATVSSSNIEEETFEGELVESTIAVDPSVNRYVQALARTVKK